MKLNDIIGKIRKKTSEIWQRESDEYKQSGKYKPSSEYGTSGEQDNTSAPSVLNSGGISPSPLDRTYTQRRQDAMSPSILDGFETDMQKRMNPLDKSISERLAERKTAKEQFEQDFSRGVAGLSAGLPSGDKVPASLEEAAKQMSGANAELEKRLYNEYWADRQGESVIPGITPDYAVPKENNEWDEVGRRVREEELKRQEKYAFELSRTMPIAASIASVGSNFANMAQTGAMIGDYLDDGKIDPNAPYNDTGRMTADLRSGVSDSIKRNIKNETLGDATAFLYDVGMSTADSAVMNGLYGPASIYLTGMGAATNAVRENAEKGYSSDRAFWQGIAAGVLEGAFEKLPTDALFDTDMLKKSVGGYIAKNALSEGVEEGGTTISNKIVDYLGGLLEGSNNSDVVNTYNKHRANGESNGRAIVNTLIDIGGEVLLDTIGGLLSGGSMAGVGAGVDTLDYKTSGKRVYSELLNFLKGTGEDSKTANTQMVLDYSKVLGKAGQTVINEMYDPNSGITALDYIPEMTKYYEAGRNGTAMNSVTAKPDTNVTAEMRQAAYIAGQSDARTSTASKTRTGAKTSESAQTNANRANLSDSAQASNITSNTQTAQNDRTDLDTQENTPADIQATRASHVQTTSTAGLGIDGGSTTDSVSVINGRLTKAMKTAQQIVSERGKQLVLVSGNMNVDDQSVRGIIVGDRMFVQADNPQFTSEQIVRNVLEDGRVDLDTQQSILADNDIEIENGTQEVQNNDEQTGTAEVGVRRGGERTDSAYSGRQTGAVAEGTGSAESRRRIERGRAADGEAASLTYGEKVSTASLGIGGGADNDAVRVVKNGMTKAMKNAKKEAAKRGKRITFVSGNMTVNNQRVRGVITGDRIFVQVDHARFTSEQITQHELGHDMIAVGEVDVDAVKDKLAEKYTPQQLDEIAEMYIAAYRDSDMTADEAWEEMICDSLGDMNIFAGALSETAERYGGFLKDVKAQTEETRAEARGPPVDIPIKVSFSMESPVEQTQNLVALHNMNEEKIRRTLHLGAWPSPSIAIVQASQGHTDYGDYSAVFARRTIDPQADSRNKIYGSDAWTPTHNDARVEQEVNYDVKRKFQDDIELLAKNVADGIFVQYSVLDMAGVGDETSMDLSKIAEKLANNYDGVKAAYLADNGRDVEVVFRTKNFDALGNDALRKYIAKVGEQELARMASKMMTGERLNEREIETAKDVIIEQWIAKNEWRLKQKPELRDKRIANQRKKLSDIRAEDFVRNAWDFYEDGGADTNEIDRLATAEKLQREVDVDAVEKWTLERLQGLLGEPGIYNGKDVYTDYGHRGFWETHVPLTAENIVKAMYSEGNRRGVGSGITATGLQSVASPEYRTVEDVKTDSHKLGRVEESELEARKDEVEQALSDLYESIYNLPGATVYNIPEAILNAASKRSVKGVINSFNRDGIRGMTNDLASRIIDVFNMAANLPTEYFEAKPERVVGFEEAIAVLAPDNAPTELISEMRDRGLNVLTYEHDNKEQRLEILNGLDGARFSREETNLADIRRENAELKKQVEHWLKQVTVTKNPVLSEKSAQKSADKLLEKYESSADAADIAQELKTLGEGIISKENPLSWKAVKTKAIDIAQSIIGEGGNTDTDFDASLAEEYIANDVINMVTGSALRQVSPTIADKYEAAISKTKLRETKKRIDAVERVRERSKKAQDALKQKHKEQMSELRKEKAAHEKEALQNLRDKKNEEIQKRREHEKEALKNLRDEKNNKIQELKDKQKKAQIVKKIFDHTQRLSEKLMRPTDNKHIPQKFHDTVARLLEAINLEDTTEYEYTTDGKYKRVKAGDVFGAEPTRRTAAFRELREIYRSMRDEFVIDADFEGTSEQKGLLEAVIDMENTPIKAMSLEQLDTVYKTIQAIEGMITNYNKLFYGQRWRVVSDAAGKLRLDNIDKRHKKSWAKSLRPVQNGLTLDMLMPNTYLHMMGETGDEIFRMMRNAQDREIRMIESAIEFNRKLFKDIDINKIVKTSNKVTLGGRETTASTAELLEIYVLSKREASLEHFTDGGTMLESYTDTKGKRIEYNTPIRNISEAEIRDIESYLRKNYSELVDIADKMQDYLSTTVAKWGNDESMRVYGYEKFGEKNYWKIRSNDQDLQKSVEKDFQITSVAHKGFTRALTPHANTSIYIGSIFDTYLDHILEMANYAAWLGTLEDINRIRNFKFKDGEGNRIGTSHELFDIVHGKGGERYLSKLLADISHSSVKLDSGSMFNALIGKGKAAAIGANLRVILQQPTAGLRAMAMINPVYLAEGVFTKNGWEKAKKYTAISQWKDWGYFDISTGRQLGDLMLGNASVLDKISNKLMWAAGAMDSMTWGIIWGACEMETKHRRKDLEAGSEEFYQEVAKRFNEIIDYTQVVDGILQRSGYMRNPDGIAKMATSFMSEPTKIYNMVYSAGYDVRAAQTPEALKKALKTFSAVTVSVTISNVINSAVQSIVDALRNSDKEKKYWEKWLNAFWGFTGEEETFSDYANAVLDSNMLSSFNPATYIPYIKDILSIIQGYDVTRMDMDGIESTIKAVNNFTKAVNGDGKYTIANASANVFAELSRLLGLPVANIKRDVLAAVQTIANETDNYLLQYRIDRALYNLNFATNKSSFMVTLYEAYKNDQEAYDIIYKDMYKDIYAMKLKEVENDPDISPEDYPEEARDKTLSWFRGAIEAKMKADEGVESVKDLSSRWLPPEQMREYDATIEGLGTQSDGAKKYAENKASGSSEGQYDALAEAYDSDEETYNAIYDDMISSGVTENEIRSAIENRWKKEQNVKDVEELDKRWLSPDEEDLYDSVLGDIQSSSLWARASKDLKAETLEKLYDLAVKTDTETSAGSRMQAKIDGGRAYGIDEGDYILYLMARSMADKPNDNGNLGTYTNDEIKAAIDMLGLSASASAYLWEAAGKNEKSNPWR